jgi:hypothetical protein
VKMPSLRSIPSNKSNGAAVRRPGRTDRFRWLVRKLLDPICADDFDVKVKLALAGRISPAIPREYNLFSVRRKCRPPRVSGQSCERRDANVLIVRFSSVSCVAFAVRKVEDAEENQEHGGKRE